MLKSSVVEGEMAAVDEQAGHRQQHQGLQACADRPRSKHPGNLGEEEDQHALQVNIALCRRGQERRVLTCSIRVSG